ncbi:MAG: hypothetical protein K0Q74_50 [Gammaproteobacteria bacterium]|jgi:outer membrane protein assembly factor BamE|nr:hypothetical protein [Gammaproteobacteria bacterium]
MQKFTTTILFTLFVLLTACSLTTPYQPNIQQGNLISEHMVSQLKVGMSKEQVIHILGAPILSNAFDNSHWAYAYTFQQKGGPITKKHLDLYFQGNQLTRIGGNYTP